jgi:hypothetical protein
MGHCQDSNQGGRSASGRRLGWRICLRKGCGRWYRARQWNQRYCQEAECLRLVHRWQGTKRQRERWAVSEGRQKHAAAERERRQRSPSLSKPCGNGDSMAGDTALPPGAWSRSKAPLPDALCDRPGCYEPPRHSCRSPAAYCSDACREAMRRVRDRQGVQFGGVLVGEFPHDCGHDGDTQLTGDLQPVPFQRLDFRDGDLGVRLP